MLKKILPVLFAAVLCLTTTAELRMTGGGIGGTSQAAALSGATLCIGEGPTLSVLNVSSPGSPQVLGRLRLSGKIESLSMDGNRAFAACGSRGVHIVDLSSPANPAVIGTIPSSSHSYAAAASGNTVLVADGGAGLRRIDISDPAAPSETGSLETEGPARAVVLQGSLAYVLDYHLGLLIVDVAGLTTLGSVESLPFGRDIHLSGSNILLVDEKGLFALVDVSSFSSPSVIATTDLAGPARAVSAEGSYAFAALGTAGVQPVNISTPASPAPAAALALPGEASDLTISGSTAFVAGGSGGLRVLDISAPALPAEIEAVQHGTRAAQITADENIAFIAAGEEGVNIYSLADPDNPIRLGGCATGGNARDLALTGDILYVADDLYGLTAVDVSAPSAPSVQTTSFNHSLTAVRILAANSEILAASDGHRIQLFNALSPVGTCDVGGRVFDLAFRSNLLLAAAGDAGLLVIDASDTGSPTVVGTYDTAGAAIAVTVSGNAAYVVDDETGSLRIDLSNPAAPVLDATVSESVGARGVALSGDTAVTAGNALAQSADISPVVPLPLDTFTKLVRAMKLAAYGSSILVAEEEAGVAILSLDASSDSDSDQMPDSWEQQIVDADPDDGIDSVNDVMAEDDFDGDGLCNEHEYIAGTDPTDPDSVFAQMAPKREEAGGFTVQWHSVNGKLYTVYRSTSLADGFAPIATGIAGAPPVNQYTDTEAAGFSAFYVITVQ